MSVRSHDVAAASPLTKCLCMFHLYPRLLSVLKHYAERVLEDPMECPVKMSYPSYESGSFKIREKFW
jgi:hypothetical protein